MDKQKILIIIGIALFIIAISAGFLYMRDTDNNNNQGSWVCVDGEWQSTGNPSEPQPDEPCEIGGELDEHGCLTSGGYSWCQAQERCIRTWEETCELKLENLEIGQTVSSPLVVRGEAPGSWFFEANFPIKLYDQEDELISETFATALDDWMTTEMVRFEATINFDEFQSGNGKIVFEKANPSGLAENEKSETVMIRFSGEGSSADNSQRIIEVFFSNYEIITNDDCVAAHSVTRNITRTDAIGRAAIDQLLVGPTQGEKDIGYFTSINEGVELKNLVIENGVAKADFNEKLDEGISGSCSVTAIRSQIINTLKQFPTVDQVIISINGRTEDILQP